MLFVRSRDRTAEVWHRFVVPSEGFVVGDLSGLFAARVVANADRALVLFSALAAHLARQVEVAVEDVRSGQNWRGSGIDRDAVREAALRAAVTLSVVAGVELAVWDDQAQVTLSPHLEVHVYARSERWYYFLRGLDLERFDEIPPRSWRLDRAAFPSAPALSAALRHLTDDLHLTSLPVPP